MKCIFVVCDINSQPQNAVRDVAAVQKLSWVQLHEQLQMFDFDALKPQHKHLLSSLVSVTLQLDVFASESSSRIVFSTRL